MNRLTDVMAMGDRMSYSLAKDKDSKQGFYSKTKPDGSMGAANGKRPFKARVSNGEVVGNFEEGWASQVPGKPNNEDSKITWLRPSDFVISNKFGLSDYAKATGDYAGALNMQDILMRQYKNKAKNGKLPKYVLGTAGEYALATIPHFAQYVQGLTSYNRAKNAPIYAPKWEGGNGLGEAAINQLYSDMIDPRQYMNMSNRNYRMAAWNAHRTPGLGLGGRAVLLDSLYKGKLAQDAETMMKIDEANRTQRNTAANMKYNYGDKLMGLNYESFWKNAALRQQANAAREYWMEQAQKNQVMSGINAASDLLKVMQTNRANEIQNKMIGLYDDQSALEWARARQQYPGLSR